jgi:hypothetical protein
MPYLQKSQYCFRRSANHPKIKNRDLFYGEKELFDCSFFCVNLSFAIFLAMAFMKLRTSVVLNIVIVIAGVLVSGFLLLFGVVNLINPDVPDAYLAQNTKVSLAVCGIVIIFLLIVISPFCRMLLKNRSDKTENIT